SSAPSPNAGRARSPSCSPRETPGRSSRRRTDRPAMPLSPAVVKELQEILGSDGLILTFEGRLTYECHMHTFYKPAPHAVALPTRAAQVEAIVRCCRRERIPIVPRGC